MHNEFIYSLFLVFSGAAILATVALYTRQALLVAYIVLGVILGPSGLAWITNPELLEQFSDFGIIFLLFLLGLHLPPQNLFKLLKETTWVTLLSSGLFALIGYLVALATGFTMIEAVVVGISMMFSSTIITLKLLPTTVLHHQRTGEIVISILLMQDIIAIFALLFLNAAGSGGELQASEALWICVTLPGIIVLAFVLEKFVLQRLLRRFNRIHEYVFLAAIGWCLAFAVLADTVGLSYEVGAFIAGIALASSPIARFIAESLKPLRDFFLILFFFSLGAGIDLILMLEIIFPALILAGLMLTLKPFILRVLLSRVGGDTQDRAWEVGFRLGQASEFSLLVAYLALETGLIGEMASYLIQGATILTFVASSYLIVLRYPTPIAVSDRLRRD